MPRVCLKIGTRPYLLKSELHTTLLARARTSLTINSRDVGYPAWASSWYCIRPSHTATSLASPPPLITAIVTIADERVSSSCLTIHTAGNVPTWSIPKYEPTPSLGEAIGSASQEARKNTPLLTSTQRPMPCSMPMPPPNRLHG